MLLQAEHASEIKFCSIPVESLAVPLCNALCIKQVEHTAGTDDAPESEQNSTSMGQAGMPSNRIVTHRDIAQQKKWKAV